MGLAGQIVSVVAMALVVLSFQMKSNKTLLVVQMLANLLFATSYFLLGVYTAAIVNLIAMLRSLALYFWADKKSVILLITAELIFVVASVLTYAGIPTILVYIASLVDTYSMWKNDGKLIRYSRLFVVSPLWLVHNIIRFSLGGLICEIFSIISCIVAFIRYKKEGFTK